MKKALAFAGVLLVAGSLTACGGDGSEEYCKDLKAASTQFKSLNSGDVEAIDKAFKTFHQLADEAPSDIEDEWKTYDGAIKGLEDALKAAKLTLADLPTLRTDNLPEGVDEAKLKDLVEAVGQLREPEFTAASDAITDHATDECKVDLN